MFSKQISTALERHRETSSIFGGVFARDKLPRIPRQKTIAYVVNTDPAHRPGQHWVAFYLNKDTVYFFDPYGLKPVGFRHIMSTRKNKVYFNKRLQGQGQTCGHYCLYFILAMRTKQSFNIFGDDFNANDRNVQLFVNKNFRIIDAY